MTQAEALDLELLPNLRVVVSRVGEMDLARYMQGRKSDLGIARDFNTSDLHVQGNIKPMRSLTEPLQVAKDNGAKRALIPIENKRNVLHVPADVVEFVDSIFYGDSRTAAMNVLG